MQLNTGDEQADAAREKLKRESRQLERVRVFAQLFTGPDALLPSLMIVTYISLMIAGFLWFNDLAQMSVKRDLLIISDSQIQYRPRREGHIT